MEAKHNGSPKENSWGDIAIQAAHKPGMTDIRPSTKSTSRHCNHLREAHLKTNTSAVVFDQHTMQTLKAKLAAAKQVKEQRYIHAQHHHHEPHHTTNTHTPPSSPPSPPPYTARRVRTTPFTLASMRRNKSTAVCVAATCCCCGGHQQQQQCGGAPFRYPPRRRRHIVDDIYVIMRGFVHMSSATLRAAIARDLHRGEVAAKLRQIALRLHALQMALRASESRRRTSFDVVDAQSTMSEAGLAAIDVEQQEMVHCSTHSSFKVSFTIDTMQTTGPSLAAIAGANTADVNTSTMVNSKFSLTVLDARVSSTVRLTRAHSNSVVRSTDRVRRLEIRNASCLSIVPPKDGAPTLSLKTNSTICISQSQQSDDADMRSELLLKVSCLLDAMEQPAVALPEPRPTTTTTTTVQAQHIVPQLSVLCTTEMSSVFRRTLSMHVPPMLEATQIACLARLPRFRADPSGALARMLHAIVDHSPSLAAAFERIVARRSRVALLPAAQYHYPKPADGPLTPQTRHNRPHLTRIYHDYLALWRNTLAAIVTLCFRANETQAATMWPSNEKRKLANDAQVTDSWLSGGTFGSKSSVLVFRSSALAQASEVDLATKPGSKLHITFRVVQAETKLLAKLLECHGINEASPDSNDFNILWTGSHPKPGILRSMAPHQRVNHFPRSYELTRKDRLYKNIERMQHAKGLKHFDFIPQTFLMPTEYRELCSTHHRVKGPWIVKPAASSRGRGIYIVESPNQVPIEEPVVVAKYISKPLLIKGHKCDLRLYVVVTSFDPMLIYIYEEGMVRFATVKYDTTHKQLWNPCMHLCNYSINKYHSDYVKSDDPSAENVGHKWTLSALLRHLKGLGKDTAALMSQVEDLVIKAILSCGNSIVTACKMFVPNPVNCFELYGFDILIDEDLKPWLLEVNLSPSLGCDSPLDVRLKSAMLSDLLTLVGIPAVDPILKPQSPARTTSSKSLKMKISNCRRIHSADGISNHTLPKKASKGSISISNSSLTAEDNKMIKNAKSQFARRGGFVRIFPAVDSWAKYAQYLDAISGIPIAGSSTSIPYSFIGQHNNNQILYKHLYPDAPTTPIGSNRMDKHLRITQDRKRDGSLESVRRSEGPVSTPRQDRYERKLSQGHRSTLSAPKKPLQEDYSAELKRQVCEMVKNGKRLSQVEARKAFSQYLVCVLKRISNSSDQNAHIEIVLKFLQKASSYLKNPFYVKIPSQKLSEKDRAAIVAKQLNDFLYLYNRETDLYVDLDRPSQIPRNVFHEFLEHSSEGDLEELLILQNIHTVPNSKEQPAASCQGLLRCLPTTNSICFSSPEAAKKSVKVTPLS